MVVEHAGIRSALIDEVWMGATEVSDVMEKDRRDLLRVWSVRLDAIDDILYGGHESALLFKHAVRELRPAHRSRAATDAWKKPWWRSGVVDDEG